MELSSGGVRTANKFLAFLENTLNKLQGKEVSLVHLDSSFYLKEIFDYLETLQLSYIVTARFYCLIQIDIIIKRTWLMLEEEVEEADTMYQSPLWDKPCRKIIVRQYIQSRPQCSTKPLKLFQDERIYKQYNYSCYITNLNLQTADILRLYRQRANSENRIKGLKYDFGFGSINIRNFYRTEATLNYVMLAYNFISLFRQFILKIQKQRTLYTLKYKTFIGA